MTEPHPFADLLQDVHAYYSGRLAQHGPSPRGVDWNGVAGQTERFRQLERVIAPGASFSLNDIGCGYGAMLDYLLPRHDSFTYRGTDISPDMINAAQTLHASRSNASFSMEVEPTVIADYGVASGIFSVRLSRSDAEWRSYLASTLDAIDRTSRLGFAFNCLTSYSDEDKQRPDLFYADPAEIFDLCKTRYSRHVALLHDYGLYEFTILVRKTV